MNQLRREVVLIAEDDPDDQFLLKMAFRHFENSLEVRCVKDGEELMEFLLQQRRIGDQSVRHQPKIIILDLNMPKVDGRQALIEINRRPDLNDIRVIVWTTSKSDEDRIFCAKRGATDYFTKPDNYLEVETVIKDVVKMCAFH